jgi:hypothetical protein
VRKPNKDLMNGPEQPMTAIQQILEHKKAQVPFTIHLSDRRRFLVDQPDFVSVHPSGLGTSIIVYGHGPDEEHYIPIFAVTSVSKK